MTLVRWEPFRELRTFQRRMDRLFNDPIARHAGEGDEPLETSWVPAVDVHESDKAITLRAELPGLTKDDVDLTVDNGRLTVRGEKKLEKEETEGDYRRIESRYGAFYRSFPLPDAIDAEKIEANLDNGVLNVTLPKAEEAKPKRIEVSVS